jgi:hypothetical protein
LPLLKANTLQLFKEGFSFPDVAKHDTVVEKLQ